MGRGLLSRRGVFLLGAGYLAFCSLAYEFVLASVIAELTGNATLWESLAFGAFLAGLGGGTLLSDWPSGGREQLLRLGKVEVLLALVAIFACPVMDSFEMLYRIHLYDGGLLRDLWSVPPNTALGVALLVLPLAVGWLSAIELRFFLSYASSPKLRRPIASVLASYHFGGLLGLAAFLAARANAAPPHQTMVAFAVLNALFVVLVAMDLGSKRGVGCGLGLAAACVLTLPLGKISESLLLKNRHYNAFSWRSDALGLQDVRHPDSLLDLVRNAERLPTVERARTPFQLIDLVPHKDAAEREPVMFINGRFQVDATSSAEYHGSLVSVANALASMPPKSVLIIGGGDGGMARASLDLVHGLEKLVIVDIDRAVVDASRDKQPTVGGGAFFDPRVRLVIGDGVEFLRASNETFDAVIIDVTYPFEFDAARFLSVEIFRLIKRRLKPSGLVSGGFPVDLVLEADESYSLGFRATIANAGFSHLAAYGNGKDHYFAASRAPFERLAPALSPPRWRLMEPVPTEVRPWSMFRPEVSPLSDPFY